MGGFHFGMGLPPGPHPVVMDDHNSYWNLWWSLGIPRQVVGGGPRPPDIGDTRSGAEDNRPWVGCWVKHVETKEVSDWIPWFFSKDTDYLFLICSKMFCFKYLGNAACQNSPASSASSTTVGHFWVSLHSERIEDVASRSLAMPRNPRNRCGAPLLHCSTGLVAGTPEIAESRAREKSPQWPTTASHQFSKRFQKAQGEDGRSLGWPFQSKAVYFISIYIILYIYIYYTYH